MQSGMGYECFRSISGIQGGTTPYNGGNRKWEIGNGAPRNPRAHFPFPISHFPHFSVLASASSPASDPKHRRSTRTPEPVARSLLSRILYGEHVSTNEHCAISRSPVHSMGS